MFTVSRFPYILLINTLYKYNESKEFLITIFVNAIFFFFLMLLGSLLLYLDSTRAKSLECWAFCKSSNILIYIASQSH